MLRLKPETHYRLSRNEGRLTLATLGLLPELLADIVANLFRLALETPFPAYQASPDFSVLLGMCATMGAVLQALDAMQSNDTEYAYVHSPRFFRVGTPVRFPGLRCYHGFLS